MLNELSEEVIFSLNDRKLKITTAESCTGGMLAQYLTSVSGSSDAFECGFVTYSNRIKNLMLDVKSTTLNAHGAVSAETSVEMARGALIKSDADIAVSITGIAGPTGGTPDKPVGLVFVTVCTKQQAWTKSLSLRGDRRENRERSVKEALLMLIDIIDKM